MGSVTQDISPADLLSRFRGEIFSARPGYPEVLLLKVRDAECGEWWFSTFDAEFSPSDPEVFLGKTIVSADVQSSAKLVVGFSDGSQLEVAPVPLEPDERRDDLENWSLINPDGIVLEYGPGEKWALTALGHPPGIRGRSLRL